MGEGSTKKAQEEAPLGTSLNPEPLFIRDPGAADWIVNIATRLAEEAAATMEKGKEKEKSEATKKSSVRPPPTVTVPEVDMEEVEIPSMYQLNTPPYSPGSQYSPTTPGDPAVYVRTRGLRTPNRGLKELARDHETASPPVRQSARLRKLVDSDRKKTCGWELEGRDPISWWPTLQG